MLFFLFAVAAVHICQRLVEKAAVVVGMRERQASFARTAMCIGCMAWALDAAGLFMYRPLALGQARLGPALLALLVMVVSAHATIPALTNTRSPRRIVAAGLGLALGMMAGNAVLLSAFGPLAFEIGWWAAAGALLLATLLTVLLALRHRSARLRRRPDAYAPFNWRDKLVGGLTVVLLHICLANMWTLVLPHQHRGGGLVLLLTIVLFGVVSTVYQFKSLQSDARQERSMNLALLLQNSAHARAYDDGGQRLALIAERLPMLLRPDRIHLHFQPIVPVAGLQGPIRFEALLRIEDPDLQRIDPELFFLACERLGRTSFADRLIIARALHVSQAWRPGLGCGGITVNVAPSSLFDADFIGWLTQQLAETHAPPHWLTLELTEHAMISNAHRLAQVMQDLARCSVGVLMDDFGAGYSSLAMLGELPIRGIKCDRTFVSALEHEPRRQTLLRHICAMAHELQLSVTIEGIESAGDAMIVRRLGADHVQGYFFARPMPAGEVPAWLGIQGFSSRQ